jgi:hypothetical protein
MSAAAAKDTMEMNEPTSEKSAEGTTKDDQGNVAMGLGDEIVEEIGLKAQDVAMVDIEGSTTATAADDDSGITCRRWELETICRTVWQERER